MVCEPGPVGSNISLGCLLTSHDSQAMMILETSSSSWPFVILNTEKVFSDGTGDCSGGELIFLRRNVLNAVIITVTVSWARDAE